MEHIITNQHGVCHRCGYVRDVRQFGNELACLVCATDVEKAAKVAELDAIVVNILNNGGGAIVWKDPDGRVIGRVDLPALPTGAKELPRPLPA